MEPGSPLRAQIDGYVNDLAEVPSEVRTAMYADVDSASLAAAEWTLAELAKERVATVKVRLSGGRLTNDGNIDFGGGQVASANGRFVPGGSNLLSTLGEVPGARGHEVVLPLGNQRRMADLVGHPSVTPAILSALGDLGGSQAPAGREVPLIGVVNNYTDVDADGTIRRLGVLAATL